MRLLGSYAVTYALFGAVLQLVPVTALDPITAPSVWAAENHRQAPIIAFYSGSFDPPTRAHLAIIKAALEGHGASKIYVLVNKDGKNFKASIDERVALLRAGLKDLGPKVIIKPVWSDAKNGLIDRIAAAEGGDSVTFIGEDSFERLPEGRRSAKNAPKFVVIPREGTEAKPRGDVEILSIPKIAGISSTQVRKDLSIGTTPSNIDPAVYSEIRQRGLYKSPSDQMVAAQKGLFEEGFNSFVIEARKQFPDRVFTNLQVPEFDALMSRHAWIDAYARQLVHHQVLTAAEVDALLETYATPRRGVYDTYDKYRVAAGAFEPGRAALHQRIVTKTLANGQISRAPHVVFIAGSPGSGKGTVVDLLRHHGWFPTDRYAHIDGDVIKLQLPEYDQFMEVNPAEAAPMTHKEARHITDLALQTAIKEGRSFVLEATFNYGPHYENLIQKIRAQHPAAKISMIVLQSDAAILQRRVMSRAQKTGRHVPAEAVANSIASLGKSARLLIPQVDAAIEIHNKDIPRAMVYYADGRQFYLNRPLESVASELVGPWTRGRPLPRFKQDQLYQSLFQCITTRLK